MCRPRPRPSLYTVHVHAGMTDQRIPEWPGLVAVPLLVLLHLCPYCGLQCICNLSRLSKVTCFYGSMLELLEYRKKVVQ